MAINMIMSRLDNIEKKISDVSSNETVQQPNIDEFIHMFSDRLSNVEQAIEKLIAKVGTIESNLVSYEHNIQTVQSQINTLFAPGEV